MQYSLREPDDRSPFLMRNLRNIKKKSRYTDKYRGFDQPIHLIAVECSKNTRNITAFEVAHA